MKILRWIHTLLLGHILLEARLKSIDEHITIINGEMGDLVRVQTKQGEDIAYIRGKLDK